MGTVVLEQLPEQLDVADQFLAGRQSVLEPQGLPGRYGCVVKWVDRVLNVIQTGAVLGGSWAVCRYGYVNRIMPDLDIVLPAASVVEFLRVSITSGFEKLPQASGQWPKVLNTEMGIRVDILPEGQRPGSTSNPAPTTIRHPDEMGAAGLNLRYITLPALIEMKIAAGWVQDVADVLALVRANPNQTDSIRQHLQSIHSDYVNEFDRLLVRAQEQQER